MYVFNTDERDHGHLMVCLGPDYDQYERAIAFEYTYPILPPEFGTHPVSNKIRGITNKLDDDVLFGLHKKIPIHAERFLTYNINDPNPESWESKLNKAHLDLTHAAHAVVKDQLEYIAKHPCHPDDDRDQIIKDYACGIETWPDKFLTEFEPYAKAHGPLRSLGRMEQNIYNAMGAAAPNLNSSDVFYQLKLALLEASYTRRSLRDFIQPYFIRMEYDNE